jgi:hypothetical protein
MLYPLSYGAGSLILLIFFGRLSVLTINPMTIH